MIGKIHKAMVKYYNAEEHKMAFKYRPVLIIGKADSSDYIVLPISSVSIASNINKHYDIRINSKQYVLLNLVKDNSYIRTNKQTTLNYKEILEEISDLKQCYPELFRLIMNRVAEFQQYIQEQAFE